MGWLDGASRTKRAAIGGFIGLCVVGGMLVAQATRGGGVERELERMVAEIQPQLPIQVDETTQWASITSDGNTLSYRYVLDAPGAEVGSLEGNRPALVAAVCEDPAMVQGLELGARYTYAYEGNDGAPIDMFTIEDGDCAA